MVSADISEVITEVSLQMEPVGFEAGVRMNIEVAEGVNMKCSITAIKQLTHILVDNAIKYCEKNGAVWIIFKESPHSINLSVANSGKVIGKEDISHIFERFYRSDKARAGEGHGLGLSIAKTITENHGGKINVFSGALKEYDLRIGENDCVGQAIADDITGTVFTVTFPK